MIALSGMQEKTRIQKRCMETVLFFFFFFLMNAYSALITSHRVTCMFDLFIGAPRKELEGYGCFRQSGKICLRKN